MSIYDIARETGYSPATVARALNGKGYCSVKAKNIIRETASRLDYKPNLTAKELRSSRTNRILLCIPDICNPFYFRIIQSCSRVLEESGYYVMLCATEKSLKKELQMIDLLDQKYCDGVILISFDFNASNVGAIRATKRPVVLGNRYADQRKDDNFDYVYVDHIKGMELATEHLLARGCRHIALVTGDVRLQTTCERLQGFKNALAAAGGAYDGRYVVNGNYDTEHSKAAFGGLLSAGLPVDGVIASNDLAAFGILRCCAERGVRVPQDIKLVSFDNTDYAVMSSPTLTSVDMCQEQLGENLARSLLSRIDGRGAVENVLLSPTLVERESSR